MVCLFTPMAYYIRPLIFKQRLINALATGRLFLGKVTGKSVKSSDLPHVLYFVPPPTVNMESIEELIPPTQPVVISSTLSGKLTNSYTLHN